MNAKLWAVKYILGLRKIYVVVDPLSPLGSIIGFRGVDTNNRYLEALKAIRQGNTLDVGAGGVSPLAFKCFDVLSLDVRAQPCVDILASALHLPFRDESFTNIICVDMIEHIPKAIRDLLLKELIRVAKEKVVIHTPLEDDDKFLGRRYDVTFNEWYCRVHGSSESNTLQHIINIEPSPEIFIQYGFSVKGTQNANLWLRYMRLQFLLSSRFIKPFLILFAWIFYLLNRQKDKYPPFWGGICVLEKGNFYQCDSDPAH